MMISVLFYFLISFAFSNEKLIRSNSQIRKQSLPLECPNISSNDDNNIILLSNNRTEFSNVNIFGCNQTYHSKGIRLNNCALHINNCNFINSNSEKNAIYIHLNLTSQQRFGDIEINNCSFFKYYSRIGGPIFIYSTNNSESILILNCNFILNTTKITEKGGAMYINANSLTINNTHFSFCFSQKGGALYFTNNNNPQSYIDSFVQINNCTFNDNQAQYTGGSLYIETKKDLDSPFEIKNCSFIQSFTKNSKGSKGAGIYVKSQDSKLNINIIGCIFSQCITSSNGGAIYSNGAFGTIKNCTFLNNEAKKGDSIYIKSRSKPPKNSEKLTITNNCFTKSSLSSKKNAYCTLIFISNLNIEFNHNKVIIDESLDHTFVFDYSEKNSLSTNQLKISDNIISPSSERLFAPEKSHIPHFNSQPASLLVDCPSQEGFNKILTNSNTPIDISSTDLYACDNNLNYIKSTDCFLRIHHCTFSALKQIAISASFEFNRESPMEICYNQFSDCLMTCIQIKSQNSVMPIHIIGCTFKFCFLDSSAGENSKSAIDFSAANGLIKECDFNNLPTNGGQDIKYEYDPPNGEQNIYKLTITENIFNRDYESGTSCYFYFIYHENCLVDFTNNQLNFPGTSTYGIDCLDKPDVKGWTISGNIIDPSKSGYFLTENTGNLPIETPPEESPSDLPSKCPPEPENYANMSNYIYLCENPTEDSPGMHFTNAILGFYYCTFTRAMDEGGNGNGALTIIFTQDIDDIKEPIKLYNCKFEYCKGDKGSAIHFKSVEKSRLLDIKDCIFNDNTASGCGTIYINAPTTQVQIRGCEFKYNKNGPIYYDFTLGSTKYLLEDQEEGNECSLFISSCYFYYGNSNTKGGAIFLSLNDEPPKPIEIHNCSFDNCHADSTIEDIEYGGAISLVFSPTSIYSRKLLEETIVDYSLRIFDCNFTNNYASVYGGAISIALSNGELSKSIEINNCYFKDNRAEKEDRSSGGDIYYSHESSTMNLLENQKALKIIDCNFTYGESKNLGGSILLSVQNVQSSKEIEVNHCLFERCVSENGCALDILSNVNSIQFNVFECTFQNKNAIYFNAISGYVKKCNFTTLTKPLRYDCNSDSTTDTQRFKIEECNFVQDFNVKSIIFVVPKESARFDFISNNVEIKISTVVFDCDKKDKINLDWNANNNTLKPEEEGYIKTENAINLPITCESFQFTCEHSSSFEETVEESSSIISEEESSSSLSEEQTTQEESSSSSEEQTTQEESSSSSEEQTTQEESSSSLSEEQTTQEESSSSLSEEQTTQEESSLSSEEQTTQEESSSSSEEQTTQEESSLSSEEQTKSDDTQISIDESSSNENSESSESSSEEVPSTESPTDLNCVGNNRCDKTDEDEDPRYIEIADSDFRDIYWPTDGGAIHLINFGIKSSGGSFTNCSSLNGAGGGIYIKIDSPYDIPVSITGVTFRELSAIYGGAIYVYCNQENIDVNITLCNFIKNKANKKSERKDDFLFGGSAIFLTTINSNIANCTFTKNIGSAVKIYNNFDVSKKSIKDSDSSSSILLENCVFDADEESTSSIFYLRGDKVEVPVTVVDCIFKGELSKDSHQIDGASLTDKNRPPKLKIKSCEFASENERIRIDSASFLSSFETFSSKLENTKKLVKNDLKTTLILAITAASLAMAAVIAIVIFYPKYNENYDLTNQINSV